MEYKVKVYYDNDTFVMECEASDYEDAMDYAVNTLMAQEGFRLCDIARMEMSIVVETL